MRGQLPLKHFKIEAKSGDHAGQISEVKFFLRRKLLPISSNFGQTAFRLAFLLPHPERLLGDESVGLTRLISDELQATSNPGFASALPASVAQRQSMPRRADRGASCEQTPATQSGPLTPQIMPPYVAAVSEAFYTESREPDNTAEALAKCLKVQATMIQKLIKSSPAPPDDWPAMQAAVDAAATAHGQTGSLARSASSGHSSVGPTHAAVGHAHDLSVPPAYVQPHSTEAEYSVPAMMKAYTAAIVNTHTVAAENAYAAGVTTASAALTGQQQSLKRKRDVEADGPLWRGFPTVSGVSGIPVGNIHEFGPPATQSTADPIQLEVPTHPSLAASQGGDLSPSILLRNDSDASSGFGGPSHNGSMSNTPHIATSEAEF